MQGRGAAYCNPCGTVPYVEREGISYYNTVTGLKKRICAYCRKIDKCGHTGSPRSIKESFYAIALVVRYGTGRRICSGP